LKKSKTGVKNAKFYAEELQKTHFNKDIIKLAS